MGLFYSKIPDTIDELNDTLRLYGLDFRKVDQHTLILNKNPNIRLLLLSPQLRGYEQGSNLVSIYVSMGINRPIYNCENIDSLLQKLRELHVC